MLNHVEVKPTPRLSVSKNAITTNNFVNSIEQVKVY
jgi:hypothetical protein